MKSIEQIKEDLSEGRDERDLYLQCHTIARRTSDRLASAFILAADGIESADDAGLLLKQLDFAETAEEAEAVIVEALTRINQAEATLADANIAVHEFRGQAEVQVKTVCSKFGLDYEAMEKAAQLW